MTGEAPPPIVVIALAVRDQENDFISSQSCAKIGSGEPGAAGAGGQAA